MRRPPATLVHPWPRLAVLPMVCAGLACNLSSDESRSSGESEPRASASPAAGSVSPPPPSDPPPPPRKSPPEADAYRALNRHFQARATHCAQALHERSPHAQGLLALRFRLVADAEALAVDDVDVLERNELEDPALLDCIAEAPIPVAPEGMPREFDLTKLVEPRGH